MGWRLRKSAKIGPFRITRSKTGWGWSWGVGGYRKTHMANGRIRETVSAKGTGISYVTEHKAESTNQSAKIKAESRKLANSTPNSNETPKLAPAYTKTEAKEKFLEMSKEKADVETNIEVTKNLSLKLELAHKIGQIDEETYQLDKDRIMKNLATDAKSIAQADKLLEFYKKFM